MKLAIIGSKNFNNYNLLIQEMKKYYKLEEIEEIVSGGSKSVLKLVEKFCKEFGFKLTVFMPEFNQSEDISNSKVETLCGKQIIKDCTHVIAFFNGKSNDIKNIVNLGNRQKKVVYVVPIAT